MNFNFTKDSFQSNALPGEWLNREWLETNGLGDYSSSTLACCNTRKYHGLLVTGDGHPDKRAVILASLEEHLITQQGEYGFSCAQYPHVYHPRGFEHLEHVCCGPWQTFNYEFADAGINLKKELMLLQDKCLLIIRYEANGPAKLKLRPLTAFRHFHSLTKANEEFKTDIQPLLNGIKLDPYFDKPPLYLYLTGQYIFENASCWYYNVEYAVERERGFDYTEDLFCPGTFELNLNAGEAVYLAASTTALSEIIPDMTIEEAWAKESKRRKRAMTAARSIEGHLAVEGSRFIIREPNGFTGIIAGYHWFNVWGRDMLIALPWLTFHAGRSKAGREILCNIGSTVKNGLVPNMFAADKHSYNSVDASLWFIYAVHQMSLNSLQFPSVVKKELWPIIKNIISAYAEGNVPNVCMDEDFFLHVGSENTQLTWMDASVNGRPVTPRYGCPVEINALWFNALAFAQELAKRFNETWEGWDLNRMRGVFTSRFWLEDKGYMADVWRPDWTDASLRPNQLFALSLPHSILEGKYHKQAVMQVKQHLLTPYGLRTLGSGSYGYRPRYEGGPEARDAAYHQGTVWPWPLGAYAEALLKATNNSVKEVKEMLTLLTPLFTTHLFDAGVGSISEIFDAEAPYRPNGTVAQAWSVSECYRLLMLAKKAAPEVYENWEKDARTGG